MHTNIHDALRSIENMICETEFEGEFVSLKVKTDKMGSITVETETVKPEKPFTIHTNRKDEIVRRRFRKNYGVIGSPIIVEVDASISGSREWVPEHEADWVTA